MDPDTIEGYTTSAAAILDSLRTKVDGVKQSMAEALTKWGASFGGQPSTPATPQPGFAGAAAAPAPKTDESGRLVVWVANNKVPVAIVEGGPLKDDTAIGKGIPATVAGAVGTFTGGLFGGLFGGGLGGAIFGGELVTALGMAFPLIGRVKDLLTQVQGIADTVKVITETLVGGMFLLIGELFAKLWDAEVLPVSHLLDLILAFVDAGLVIVLTQLSVILNWVDGFLEGVTSWVTRFLSGVSRWLSGILNSVTGYLEKYVAYLVDGVVKPTLFDLFSGFLTILVVGAKVIGVVLKTTFQWLVDYLEYFSVRLLGILVPGAALVLPKLVPPKPIGEQIDIPVDLAKQEARFEADSMLEKFLGKRPEKPITPMIEPAASPGATAAPVPGEPFGPPPPLPKLPEKPVADIPGFPLGGAKLPQAPKFESVFSGMPRLEDLFGNRREPVTAPPPAPAPAAPQGSPTTFNGGITVQVNAQSVDREHVVETAQAIARNVLDELRRLAERDRFRAGLPTAPVH